MKEKAIPNERLRNEREIRGWSRDYVAEKIGGDSQSVGRWERGVTFPSPYYRQALCELFRMNAKELGLIKEDTKNSSVLYTEGGELQSEEINIKKPQDVLTVRSSTRLSLDYRGLLVLIAISGMVIALSALFFSLFYWRLLTPSFSQPSRIATLAHIKPGGLWVNPANGQIVHGIMHFAAQAYSTNPGDPVVNHVNFTVSWGGRWQVACIAYPPANGNIFACDANLSRLDAPVGQIKVSFDVYDQKGNVNFAPNGEHTISYSP